MHPLLILTIILVLLILGIVKFKIHPFIALIIAGLVLGVASGMPISVSTGHLLEGFASTMKWIGIIMVLGTVIGEILNETGGTERIARTVIRLVGPKRVPLTMGITGYFIAIPVFVDVAYIMLQSITESLSVASRRNVLVVGLSLTAGLTATHALLPPTPGPLAAAGIMEASIGRVILINLVVALFAATAGVLWASIFCRRYKLPYDNLLQEKYRNVEITNTGNSYFKSVGAFAPILLPIILIALGSLAQPGTGVINSRLLESLGIPAVALLLGLFIAALFIKGSIRSGKVNTIIEKSIEKSATVLLITGAGGAFGGVIKAAQIGDSAATLVAQAGFPGYILPFLLAAALTTTTGSITVSMVTSSSIVVSMLPLLNISPEMAVALVGAGSFCVFHANSSFFWLLGKMHQVPPQVLFRTFTVQSLLMGIGGGVGIAVLWLIGVR
jgi:GntP family gluconate:H+ symporter